MRTIFGFSLPSADHVERWLATKHANIERSTIILFILIMAYGIFFSSLTILRHWAFETHAWDLGILSQSLWTTAYGNRFLYHTPELFINPSGVFFGVHFSPMLLVFVPLYWVAPTPETLLVVQAFTLSLAAFPIYKLARSFVGERAVGLFFAFAYMLFPAVHYVNLYEFHVQAFLPFLLAFLVYYVLKEDWYRYFPFLLLSLMVEEHVAEILAFLGLFILWRYRSPILRSLKNRKFVDKRLLVGVLTIVLCVFWYWFTLWQRDTFFPINPLAMGEFLGTGNFATLGANSPLEVPLAIILRPGNAIQALVKDGSAKLVYFAQLFGPLAFFSFLSPAFLVPTVPYFMFSLISDSPLHHMLGVHYEAYTVSFIFAAAIFGMQRKLWKHGVFKIRRRLKIAMLFSLIFFIVVSPLGPIGNFLYSDYVSFSYGEHEQALSEVLATIPANASILTQNNIFPHVANRIEAYVIPSIHLSTGSSELAISFANQTLDTVEYILIDNATDEVSTSFALSLLENRSDFYLKEAQDNDTIFLYQRRH
jgi:uncharacterized membrane protein